MLNFVQGDPPWQIISFFASRRGRRRERAEVIDGPVGEDGAGRRCSGWLPGPNTRGIVGTDAMIAHDEITVAGGRGLGPKSLRSFILRGGTYGSA